MEFEEIRPFLAANHRAVVNTFQRNGGIQSSIVVCGAYRGHAAFVSVRGNSAKVRNLRRDPRCTVTATAADWRSYVVVEGRAKLLDSGNTEPEELRQQLREVFKVCGDGTHSDWDEYDRVMRRQDAVVVLVRPERIYGLLR
jgi:PPOX class probable F420-dependent enzyme